MGKYVKTYELFGLFKKKEKAPEEPSKKEKEADINNEFYDIMVKSVDAVKGKLNDLIKIDIEKINSEDTESIDRIELKIQISPDFIKKKIGYNLEFKNAQMSMQFKVNISPYFTSAGRVSIYHPVSMDTFELEMKKILSSDLKTSDEFTKFQPRESFRRQNFRPGMRLRNEVDLKAINNTYINDDNIELLKEEIINSILRGFNILKDNIGDILRHHSKQEALDKVNATNVEEITDILSDLIDISDDYNIKRTEDQYVANFKIGDLQVRNDEKRIVLSKTMTNIMKFLSEIQSRIEDLDLKVGIEYGNGRLTVIIYQDELKEKPVAPKLIRRRAP